MIRLFAAAALLAAPALPALAQSVHETHVEASGAAAGRSPHRAYRPIAQAQECGRPAMHSVPSGKGHVFGTHAFAGAPCAADHIALADGAAPTRQD